MKAYLPPIPAHGTVSIASGDVQTTDEGRSMATRDHDVIRQWAARHSAEPATGEATSSGPATIHVNDGGAGIRFNFPGAARFRPISWEEWFTNMDRHHLVFIYDVEAPDRGHAPWQRQDAQEQDHEEWLEAERQLPRAGVPRGATYRFVQQRTATENE